MQSYRAQQIDCKAQDVSYDPPRSAHGEAPFLQTLGSRSRLDCRIRHQRLESSCLRCCLQVRVRSLPSHGQLGMLVDAAKNMLLYEVISMASCIGHLET